MVKSRKNRQKRNFLLSQSNTKMPSLPGPMPVFFWYDIWCEAHPEPVMDPWNIRHRWICSGLDTESSKTDGSIKYKFDLLRVHQPPQFCDLTAATGPVNFDISGTGQSLQAGADIGLGQKLDPFFI